MKIMVSATALACAGFGLTLPVLASAKTIGYYRFEHATSGDTSIYDFSHYARNGTVVSGAPTYTSDRAVHVVPRTGKVDKLGLSFGPPDAASFPYTFALQSYTNATVEFWVKPLQSTTEEDIVWGSTSTTDGDTNRFVLGLHAGSRKFFVDYIDTQGNLHDLGDSGKSLPLSDWSYVAVVRKGSTYTIFLNNSNTEHSTRKVSTVVDVAPALPTATKWTINGRSTYGQSGCCQANVVLDEFRLSSKALKVSQLLITSPDN